MVLLVLLGVAQVVLLALIWVGLGELAARDCAGQSWQAERDIDRMEEHTVRAMVEASRQAQADDVIEGSAVEPPRC